jgi:transcriptional regulator GlxA family with amidase domain
MLRAGEFLAVNHFGVFGLDAQSSEHYRRIVVRFEEVARANLGTYVRIADLCRAVGVTPRTLERAVRAVHANTPVEFLHALRLTEARQTLLSTCPGASSVTKVAMRFGFRELGRFAGEYRERFGESPSETLRRSARNSCEA